MYRVVLEIVVEAKNPLEAAKTLESWIKDGDKFQYYVQNDETNEIVSVDLNEDDEDAVLPVHEYEPMIEKK